MGTLASERDSARMPTFAYQIAYKMLFILSALVGVSAAQVPERCLLSTGTRLKTVDMPLDVEMMQAEKAMYENSMQPKKPDVKLVEGEGSLGNTGCVQAPTCLEPQQQCLTGDDIVRADLPECKMLEDYCLRSVYTLPTTKLRITLPTFTRRNLSNFYKTVYDGQCTSRFCLSTRPRQQSEIIMNALPAGQTGLHITEIGCATGALLNKLQPLAANGGKLECYEPDPQYNSEGSKLVSSLRMAATTNTNLQWEVHPTLLDFTNVQENTIDIFASSHVVEHMTDPCPYMAGLYKALKPGGIVFTEVPHQYEDPEEEITRGMLHLLYFNQDTFSAMMEIGGFVKVYAHDDGKYIRSVYRKPV